MNDVARLNHPRHSRTILHVDGDSFFVSCELTRLPHLRGKPVVTGKERGIASAMSPEAKKRGITRGMRLRDMRRLCPEVVILPSDYTLYALYACRMYDIVRSHVGDDMVEEYSIDECFADLTGMLDQPGYAARGATYADIAREIQDDLRRSLGMTFSIGVGPNKVMAKIGSKWKKPDGLTIISREDIDRYLANLSIGSVWGIGRATSTRLRQLGIVTALDFARKDRAWVAEHCDKPLAEIYEEFQGAYVKKLSTEDGDPYSVQRTRTFTPPVGISAKDRAFLWSQISHHVEDACARLRHQGLLASHASFFLKTIDLEYLRAEISLSERTASPEDVLRAFEPVFAREWPRIGAHIKFRATGIALSGLRRQESETSTLSLFDATPSQASAQRSPHNVIHEAVDNLIHRFGRNAVFLGSSFGALKHDGEAGSPAPRRGRGRRRISDSKRQFRTIFLGEVR